MSERAKARDWIALVLGLGFLGFLGHVASGPLGAALLPGLTAVCLWPLLRVQIALSRTPEYVGSMRECKKALRQAEKSGDPDAIRDAERRLEKARKYRAHYGG